MSISPPKHIAIIMDGNGRWAKNKGKSRAYGHRAGHIALQKIARHASNLGAKSLTVYAFSSENWARPKAEVSAIMMLFSQAIQQNRRLFIRYNIRFSVIGERTLFSAKLQKEIALLEQQTANNTGMNLNIAANYGAKWDIVQACKNLATQVANGEIDADVIDEERFNQHLCLGEQPPVDLLIRTGGEFRISNYLLWQCAYAEFYFTPILWPAFNEQSLENAIADFNQRTRRFGGLIAPKQEE